MCGGGARSALICMIMSLKRWMHAGYGRVRMNIKEVLLKAPITLIVLLKYDFARGFLCYTGSQKK